MVNGEADGIVAQDLTAPLTILQLPWGLDQCRALAGKLAWRSQVNVSGMAGAARSDPDGTHNNKHTPCKLLSQIHCCWWRSSWLVTHHCAALAALLLA
jgi:hypothetical protein